MNSSIKQKINNRYSIIKTIGQGSMGSAFLVFDHVWNTEVALKLLRDPSMLEAFHREFDVLKTFFHPNITQIHDFGITENQTSKQKDTCFFTADFVSGLEINQYCQGKSWKQLKQPLLDCFGALRSLHGAGFVHGDIKPQNILINDQSRGVLIDLSCAAPCIQKKRTTISGTPAYLAPEILKGKPSDHRSDIYSLGVTLEELFDLLSNQPPRNICELASRMTSENIEDRPVDMDEILHFFGVETSLIHPITASMRSFVGRLDELKVAQKTLRSLSESEPSIRILSFSGPEGIGKSRILQQIKWAAQKNFSVYEVNPKAPSCIENLIKNTFSSSDGSLQGLLTQMEQLPTDLEPSVWIIDDAHLLENDQHAILMAFSRSIEERSPFLIVLSSDEKPQIDNPASFHSHLQSFRSFEIDQLVNDHISEEEKKQLLEASGGHPGAILSMLGQLAGSPVDQNFGSLPLSERQTVVIREMQPELRKTLAFFALAEDHLTSSDVEHFGIELDQIIKLIHYGFIRKDGLEWKLQRSGETEQLSLLLESHLAKEVHHRVSVWLENKELTGSKNEASANLAKRAYHLLFAEEPEKSSKLFIKNKGIHSLAPKAWRKTALALTAKTDSLPGEVHLLNSILDRLTGHTKEALEKLTLVLEEARESQIVHRARIELGQCHLRLGQTSKALEHLELSIEEAQGEDEKFQAINGFARTLTNQGQYEKAAKITEEVFDSCKKPELRADLAEASGVALCFSGNLQLARKRLDEAAKLLKSMDDPRRSVRAFGSRALVAYYMGDLKGARADHLRALELAESRGLVDQVATASLNFGTVCHQQGHWDRALASYERGMRMAVALGQTNTEALLRYNQAKLFVDLGLNERAMMMADRCEACAKRAEIYRVVAGSHSIRGEVALSRGDYKGARAFYKESKELVKSHGSKRDRAETELQLAELSIESRDKSSISNHLDRASDLVSGLKAQDLQIRLDLVRAKWLLAENRAPDALRQIEKILDGASELKQNDLEAEIELIASKVWEKQGAKSLSQKHLRRAKELWERTAAPLSSGIQEAFWNHPKRSKIVHEERSGENRTIALREQKYRLLLDINKRLNSSLETKQILDLAMDSAIELTRAERGFLLTVSGNTPSTSRKKRNLTVAVARNFDREKVDRSRMKFSRSIAEQVIKIGEPIITEDAQIDDRFFMRSSIHSMSLKSVVCVPVQSPDGILGALYLDNRFQRGLFTDEDAEILLAFADQVAIALTNARLMGELTERNRELEKERRRVEELLKGQAAEIDRLNEEVRLQSTPRDRRFNYSSIIGSSRAMEDIFALLDRVIDTELPILIQGESGTGKELIARAIHNNSPRAKESLVSINCGALPENLLESELFGYERGAFTGAEKSRKGLIVQARGGTLFLDEVGEMPRSMQVKLLRVLQERELIPLGSSKVIPVDFRLVCATNRFLRKEVEKTTFREDLYYRISAVEMTLPPLRERMEDIPPLVEALLFRISKNMKRKKPVLIRSALKKLSDYSWPGNVRQLEHVLTKAVVMSDGTQISTQDIDLPKKEEPKTPRLNRQVYQKSEVRRIAEALEKHRWNISKVSRVLGISRPTLYRRIKRYGLEEPS